MKSALTVLASVVLALLATWYAIAARVRLLGRAPEQATVLVVPGPDGVCVPRVARPVIRAHVDDTIEWNALEWPGCEDSGAFVIEAGEEFTNHFSPALARQKPAKEHAARVTHDATPGVSVSYTATLANGQRTAARIVFF